jgi:hypothetical protein
MTELHKAQANCIIQTGTDQKYQTGYAPNKIVDRAIDIDDRFKKLIQHIYHISFTQYADIILNIHKNATTVL